jgi:hypothetical protein
MTFEQFQSTRTPCDDLGKVLADAQWEGEPAAKSLLYLGVLYIDQVMPHWPEQARQQGKWHLLLNRSEYISDDLESLERELYQFALAEGYCGNSACQHRDDGRGRCIDCDEFLPTADGNA